MVNYGGINIRIEITGLKENLEALNRVKQNLPKTRQLILEDVTSTIVRDAKIRAHVITGNMKRSIGVSELDVAGGNATVEAAAEYSHYENRRGGSHAFFDQAITTTKYVSDRIVKQRVDQLLIDSGVPTS